MVPQDSIFAVATGRGKTALAVIRVSGRAAGDSLLRIAGRVPAPRRASLAHLHDPRTGDAIDHALVLWFPAPASFTGEDCAEFHIHGGRAVLKGMLDALAGISDLRLAEPGEFARRAFANGKMDLSAVEGLADLIDAETDVQRRQALRQMNGRLAGRVDAWRHVILEARALIEAEIDFADEAEAPSATLGSVAQAIMPVLEEIDEILQSGRSGEIVREGFSVVLAGPPNSGKSTLLNALAHRDVAIVSEHAGTTRDVIEVRLDLGGILVVLADTAGLRDCADPVEAEGMSRTRRRMADADLVLWLTETGEPAGEYETVLSKEMNVVPVQTKIDRDPGVVFGDGLRVSALKEQGMRELIAWIREKACQVSSASHPALISRERHRQALARAANALQGVVDGPTAIELVAEHLRVASRSLESVIGRIDVEDVLDAIFANFCLGK